MKPKIHEVTTFVGGCAHTRCGKYVDNERVTAYPNQVTCRGCRPARKEKR